MPAACDLRCDRAVAQRDRLRCCRKHLCGPCVTKVLRVDYMKQQFRLSCPFCRRLALVTAKRVKKLMAESCPDHARVLESELGPVAVVHAPDPEGSYGESSTLQMLPTSMPDLVDELLDAVDELSEDLAGAQATCKTLEEENESLRQSLPHRQGTPPHPDRPTFVDLLLRCPP